MSGGDYISMMETPDMLGNGRQSNQTQDQDNQHEDNTLGPVISITE